MNILELKEDLERDILLYIPERIEVADYHQNLGYNFSSTIKFYIEDEFVADITGGENIGWESGDISGDYFEEVVDTLRVRFSKRAVK